jgi:hypothetical protein
VAGLTETDVNAWLEEWRRRLAPEWEITLVFDQPLPESEIRASIDSGDDYHIAVLRLDSGWREGWPDERRPGISPEEEVEVAIVHELLHAMSRDMAEVVGRVREEFLSPEGAKWLELSFNHAEEGFIERMARLLVRVGSVRGRRLVNL